MVKELDKFFRILYKEHFDQGRHAENERLWYGNVFAVIFAGTTALIKDSFFQKSSIPIFIFLSILSILGILFSIRLHTVFKSHVFAAYEICKKYQVDKTYYEPHYVSSIIRKISIWKLFPTFYSITFSGLIGIILFILTKKVYFYIYMPICLLIILLITIWSFNLRYSPSRTGMDKELEK